MWLFFLIISNEIRKNLLITWHYKFNVINEFIELAIGFLGTALLMNYGDTNLEGFAPALLGYIVWVYASRILNVNFLLTLEGRSGTLEQMYMSPVRPAFIFIGAIIATLISSTIMIGIMAVALSVVCHIVLPIKLAALPVLLLTLLGLIGFGFAIASATLLYKNVEGCINLLNTTLFYLNGSMLPIDLFPTWIQHIAQTLPTTQGIIVLRQVMLKNESLFSLLWQRDFLLLCVNSGFYFFLGVILFYYGEKIARTRGCLGQY